MRNQFAKTMLELGINDPDLFVVVGDIGEYGLRDFASQCPGRFINAGIREQAMMSVGAGLALTGYIPVIHSITPFVVERCFEQIKVDFCYQRFPGNIVSVGAGFDYSALGCTHHSYSDIACISSLPGTQVFYPGSPYEFDVLFKKTYRSGLLNYFRLGGRNHSVPLNEALKGADLQPGCVIPIQQGGDITIVVSGPLLELVMEGIAELPNVSVAVMYAPTIKPFDYKKVNASVFKTKRVLVIEDHSIWGGLANQVLKGLQNENVLFKSKIIGIEESFLTHYGSFTDQCKNVGMDKQGIVNAIEELLKK